MKNEQVLANYKTETDMKASTENLNTLGEQPKQIETVSSQKKKRLKPFKTCMASNLISHKPATVPGIELLPLF